MEKDMFKKRVASYSNTNNSEYNLNFTLKGVDLSLFYNLAYKSFVLFFRCHKTCLVVHFK